jgi:hypothetical protein
MFDGLTEFGYLDDLTCINLDRSRRGDQKARKEVADVITGAGDLHRRFLLQSLSFRPLAGVNATFFDAAIVIASPLDGLRP